MPKWHYADCTSVFRSCRTCRPSEEYGQETHRCQSAVIEESECRRAVAPYQNGELTPHDVTHASNVKRWWTCDKGKDHEWDDSPNHRISGRGCPFCAGKRVADSNRLTTNYPHLEPEWHPIRNGDLMPDDITVASGRKVWWVCGKGHEYEAAVASRTQVGSGCPYCAGKRVSDANRLSALYPDISREWHPTKNGKLTPDDVSYGSNKSRWWICREGHEWETVVCYRTIDGTGCPYCAGKRVTNSNRLSTLYPEVAESGIPP